MKKSFLFLSMLGVILVFNSKSLACSCGLEDSPCEAYGNAASVFIGFVKKAEYTKTDGFISGKFQINVEETFVGDLEPEVEAFSSTMSCGYSFEENRRYLIYTYAKPKEGEKIKSFFASYCTRTAPLEEANEDLDFLRNQRKEMKGGRIYGKIIRDYSLNYSLPKDQRLPPMSGVQVKIIGQIQTYLLFTDKNGWFELSGLTSDEYFVEVPFPTDYLIFGSAKRKLFINNNGCATTNFYIQK